MTMTNLVGRIGTVVFSSRPHIIADEHLAGIYRNSEFCANLGRAGGVGAVSRAVREPPGSW